MILFQEKMITMLVPNKRRFGQLILTAGNEELTMVYGPYFPFATGVNRVFARVVIHVNRRCLVSLYCDRAAKPVSDCFDEG